MLLKILSKSCDQSDLISLGVWQMFFDDCHLPIGLSFYYFPRMIWRACFGSCSKIAFNIRSKSISGVWLHPSWLSLFTRSSHAHCALIGWRGERSTLIGPAPVTAHNLCMICKMAKRDHNKTNPTTTLFLLPLSNPSVLLSNHER